jgi:hypothetical protein
LYYLAGAWLLFGGSAVVLFGGEAWHTRCFHNYIYIYIYIYRYVHTYMHTYIHTYMHAYIHAYTHMRAGWEQDAVSQRDFICAQDRETGRLSARDFNHINGNGPAPIMVSSQARRSPAGSTRNETIPSFRLDAESDGISMQTFRTQTQTEDLGSIPRESPV